MRPAFRRSCHSVFSASFLCLSLLACNSMPGRPKPGPEVPRPSSVKSFEVLYAENCAGCHGENGQRGPATDLANAAYQALIDDKTLRDITANGQQGTLMPGFAKRSGGPLTDEQVDILVSGMRARWSNPNALAATQLPSYAAQGQGDPQRGEQVYSQYCARCHGARGAPPGRAGSVVDGTFLGLVSDQVLRTTIIAGRPDLGMPDWRGYVTGKAMADQEVSDVVAWLASQRPKNPGQPYRTQTASNQQPAAQQGQP